MSSATIAKHAFVLTLSRAPQGKIFPYSFGMQTVNQSGTPTKINR